MVTSLDVQKREVVLGGKSFGDSGAYEKIAGTIRFTADPSHPLHRQITDIELARKTAGGQVEFSADFYLLKPVETRKGKGRLLLDVANRGRKVALGMFNSAPRVPDPGAPADFGNGFLMRHGYTLAWVGWQPDVPRKDGLIALDVPRAKGVTGFVRCELRPNTRVDILPLADRYHVPNPTIDVADPQARVTVREHAGAAAVDVPRSAWHFSDPGHLELKGGFIPGAIYDVVYRSADPLLVGLGFLAVRDTAAWLRWAPAASGNPCAGEIERAYLFGVSQSGRFLRHMLYLGLDEDEQGRMVFDAVMPHVAGGRRGEFNLRFGQPSLNAQEAVGSLPPFNDEALFKRIRERGSVPRIFATNTSAEYWRGDGSLIHTDAEGNRDAEPAEFVRTYLFAGTQHTPGALPPLDADPNTGSRGYHRFNVSDYAPLLRSALVNLDRWVSEAVEPPPSAFPRIADGTAVEAESLAGYFRALPGTRFPDRVTRPLRLDFGPEVERGIAQYPPRAGAPYRTYVSAVDADGNEVAGIRGPELAAPLATLTGWNPRHPEQGGEGDLMSMMGSTLPFALTRADRERGGDPRQPIAERYPSRAAYLERVRECTGKLIAERHVLAEDLEAIVERAGQRWDWIHASSA
ncbi:MAG TPA: alpha/beta hydrolase domain-containing protein [Candidatus Binataceae bacterium]|nr:alpha/beta hydrolase domain-containing protein [Candidatus Binataceae bacterium]